MFPVRTDLTCLTKPVCSLGSIGHSRTFSSWFGVEQTSPRPSRVFLFPWVLPPQTFSSCSWVFLAFFSPVGSRLRPVWSCCGAVASGKCWMQPQCLHLICVSTGYCLLFIILFMKVWSVLLLPHKIKLIIHLSWKCRVYFLWRCILNSILVLDDLAVPILVYICLSLPPSFPTMLPSYVSTS